MQYWWFLAGISLLFVLLERLRPWRRSQRFLRDDIFKDFFYLAFNGHFFAVLILIPLCRPFWNRLDAALEDVGIPGVGLLAGLSPGLQFCLGLVVLDFVEWLVHNALHRNRWLWELHKIHHSIVDLDWIGVMRFHWAEIIIYKCGRYLPLMVLGCSDVVLFWMAVFGTFMGHFNHSNLDLHVGLLRYVINHPRMHIWHHHDVKDHPVLVNFGISLSLWDWIFKTAFIPDAPPDRLGFPDLVDLPRPLWRQLLWPLCPK